MTDQATPDHLAWYRMMVRIRHFEDKVQELSMAPPPSEDTIAGAPPTAAGR